MRDIKAITTDPSAVPTMIDATIQKPAVPKGIATYAVKGETSGANPPKRCCCQSRM